MIKIGSRVRYIHVDNEEDKQSGYYPPIGTEGTVMETDILGEIRVQWDSGTKGDGLWYCNITDVEEVPDKHLDHFASQVLDQNADELFPNGNVAADLWDNYCEGR